MNLQDLNDKVGDIRNRVVDEVTDKLESLADKYEQDAEEIRTWEEEHGRRHPKEVLREFFTPVIRQTLFTCGVFLAASYGARYGVTRAIANGRLKVKKH